MRHTKKALVFLLLVNGTITYGGSPDPSVKAVRALLHRLLPTYPHRDAFEFQVIPQDDGDDVFEIETEQARVIIRGNSCVSMAMGLNWYLKYSCNCHVSWCGSQLNMPDSLPPVEAKIRRTAWAKYRYFLNYCCFGYSLPWWDFSQWERLIDWMALNGVNAPLAVTGQEATWQAVCKRLELSDEQIGQFLAGPPYLPFGWMGCLDGWGGPLPARWIDSHETLGKQILARERELGMTPIQQGFTGHVPPALAQKYPDAKLHTIDWIEWQTFLLDPLDPLFTKVAQLFLEEQTRRFGTDHLYAADTFIEMKPPSGDLAYLDSMSKAIYRGMSATDPDAVWVLQTWIFLNQRDFWTQPRIDAFLSAIPDERMLCLDLACEDRPQWSRTHAFYGKPWLWCNVQNYGRNVYLGGALNRNNAGLMAAQQDPGRGKLVGLGFVNEGLGYNPVVYDLMFEMAWRNEAVDTGEWVKRYAEHRYGQSNVDAEQAWEALKDTVYSGPSRTRSILDHYPSLNPASGPPYHNARLADAWRDLLHASEPLGTTDTYRFDLVNITRQVLSNYAATLQHQLADAYQMKNAQDFQEASKDFLQLMRDLDELLATRKEFLLGDCLENAKRWGKTDKEKTLLEWNARRVLTLWGTTKINDYARKEWSGMISGYYLKRWEWYLREVGKSLNSKHAFDNAEFDRKLRQWMVQWSDGQETYPAEPSGDSVAVSRRLWKQYRGAFKPNAISLTAGKPVICSHALPGHAAHLANDGWSNNTNSYWATDVTQHPEAWWQVDLETPTSVGRIGVVGYFGDNRHYGFTVETSLDGRIWDRVADQRDNKEPTRQTGHICRFQPRPVRYIRVTQTHNSANAGRHLVEVMAYAE